MPAQTVIRLRRGTAAQWASANPVLASGEMGIETDTRKFKFGNGTVQWNSIPYASAGGGTGGGFFVSETAPVGANIGDIWYCSDVDPELGGRSFIRYDGYWVEINPGLLGPAGNDGAAASIAVGTVTTGAAGSSATVTNSGTSSAAVFNFTIPAGATGATGAAGTNGIDGDPAFHPFLVAG